MRQFAPSTVRSGFTIGRLPQPIYRLLKDIQTKAGKTQRQVIVAGVLALTKLDAPTLTALWDEVERWCPRGTPRNGTGETA